MAKLKLDTEPGPYVFLIAISSHVNDYRLCWALNNSLGIELARRPKDIRVQGPEHPAYFSVFDYIEEDTQASVTLVSNHAPEGVLMTEQRQADFFLVVDSSNEMQPPEMLERVRSAEFVLTAFNLEMHSLKSGYKLLQ